MPKKKKGKKKKNEPKVNIEEEIAKVATEMGKINDHTAKLLANMSKTEESNREHRKQIREYKRQLAEQKDLFEEDLAAGEEEYETQYFTDQHTIEDLWDQNRELRVEISGADAQAQENDTLRKRIKELDMTLRRQTKMFMSELDMRHKERFDTRVAMERTFRGTLRNAKNVLESDAIAEIERESKEAVVKNVELREDLDKQSKGIRKMCAYYNASDDNLVNLKIRTDLSESRNGMQSQKILRLQKTNSAYKKEIRVYQADLRKKEDQERKLLKQLEEIETENVSIQSENLAADITIDRLMNQVADLSNIAREPRMHKKYKAAKGTSFRSTHKTVLQEFATAKEPSPADFEKMWNSAARVQQDDMIF